MSRRRRRDVPRWRRGHVTVSPVQLSGRRARQLATGAGAPRPPSGPLTCAKSVDTPEARCWLHQLERSVWNCRLRMARLISSRWMLKAQNMKFSALIKALKPWESCGHLFS
jgi:hypothetical protein